MRMCNGFDLVWPGLVEYALWRPERPGNVSADPGINSLLYGAVGRKPLTHLTRPDRAWIV